MENSFRERLLRLEKALSLDPLDAVAVAALRAELEALESVADAKFSILGDSDERLTTLMFGLFGGLLIAIIASLAIKP